MKRHIWKFLGAAAVTGSVLAPTTALAQGDYPTPPSTPTVDPQVAGAEATRVGDPQTGDPQAARPVSGGATLPFTGGEIAALAVAGAGVTGAGVLLVGLGRRRAHSQA
jgi:hypothetical protein